MSVQRTSKAAAVQGQPKPLVAWSDAQLQALRDRVLALLGDWHTAWGVGPTNAAVHLEGICLPDTMGLPRGVGWYAAPSQAGTPLVTQLAGMLFAEPQAKAATGRTMGPMARDVAQAALQDWQVRAAAALDATLYTVEDASLLALCTVEPANTFSWTGDLRLRFVWCGTPATLLLPHAVVDNLLNALTGWTAPSPKLAEQAPLENLAQALATHTLSLRVELTPVELSLGELNRLDIGDVIRLPHSLGTPLQVHGPGQTPLCSGWLGKRAGHVAIELSRATVSAPSHPLNA